MGVDEKYIIDNIVTYSFGKTQLSLTKLFDEATESLKIHILNHFYSIEINMYMMSQ